MGLTSDKYLDQDEVIELIQSLSLIKVRDRLLIELALYSGARESELLSIDSTDLNKKKRSVFIKQPLKGSNQREIPLPDEFFSRLLNYSLTNQGLLFPISDSRVRQIWMSIRPVKKKFHSLRHTFGRRIYSLTKDIRRVQVLLGHKSIASTGIYTEVDYEVDENRKAMGL